MQSGMVFEQVCSDLENSGYEVQPFIIPAVSVDAPHRRDRIWFIAHALSDNAHRKEKTGELSEAPEKQKQNRSQYCSAGQSLRAAFSEGGKRFEKNGFMAKDIGNAESAGQQGCNEGQGKMQYGRTGSGSLKCSASDSESKRGGRFACKKYRIEKRQVEQGKQKGCEIRGKSERRACDSADSASCKSREQTKQKRRKDFSRRSFKNTSDTKRDGYEERYQKARRKIGKSMQGRLFKFERKSWKQLWIKVAAELCGVDDGLPAKLDRSELSKSRHRIERLKALGNAIVPQVAIEIMGAIKKADEVGST